MAVRQLSTALLPHLNTQEQRVINLLSTEEKDGKTHVARLIEEYWSRHRPKRPPHYIR